MVVEGGKESETQEECVKLFVGQVPKHMSEDTLLPIFKEVALVDELYVLRDTTQASRGCCFVICPSRQEADKAINALHNKRIFPGESYPLVVKYADGELERLEHRLFVGMLPKNVSYAELYALFSKYGTIKDLHVMRGSQQTSIACAFVTYKRKEHALAALADRGKYKMEGVSVYFTVKWADTEEEREARRAQKAQSQASMMRSAAFAHQRTLFGAWPMHYIPLYNGSHYQANNTSVTVTTSPQPVPRPEVPEAVPTTVAATTPLQPAPSPEVLEAVSSGVTATSPPPLEKGEGGRRSVITTFLHHVVVVLLILVLSKMLFSY